MSTSMETPRSRRSLLRSLMFTLRRGHLYLGLFLVPWAVLYGITGFLFNHPTAFSDQPTATFGRSAYAETLLATAPSPQQQAEEIVRRLNEIQTPTTPYTINGDAAYAGRAFAFATVKTSSETISILIDMKNGGGTVRSAPATPSNEPKPEPAPFATTPAPVATKAPGKGRTAAAPREAKPQAAPTSGILLEQPLQERIRAAIPTILERTGFATDGEIIVTSVPDVVVPMTADGRNWNANYAGITGAVSGSPEGSTPPKEMSWRRFLLRLHLIHGYPGEKNSVWVWAVIVDVMSFTMCFWAFTGLIMWWQIRSARRLGIIVLILSTISAAALGFALHGALTT